MVKNIEKEINHSAKASKVLEYLNKDVYEKEEIFSLSLLALLSGESIFLIGNPGVAKSLVARRIKNALWISAGELTTKEKQTVEVSEFEYLMNKFSTPEDIFGPLDISELEKGIYKRKTEGYLPTASVAFLDEIWKAGPAIQNTLLTIINERIYRNGTTNEKVPLKLLIAASNEFPNEGQGLEALYDRFTIRFEVSQIRDESNFVKLINNKTNASVTIPNEFKFVARDIEDNIKKIEKMKIEGKPLEFIINLKKILEKKSQEIMSINDKSNGIYISDRRWAKVTFLIKSSAFYNNRQVTLQDLPILTHTLWSTFEDREVINYEFDQLVAQTIDVEDFDQEIKQIDAFVDKMDESYTKTVKQPIEIDKLINFQNVDHFEFEVDNNVNKYFISKKEIDSLTLDVNHSIYLWKGTSQNDVEKVSVNIAINSKSKRSQITIDRNLIAKKVVKQSFKEIEVPDLGYSEKKENDLKKVIKNIENVRKDIEIKVDEINGDDNIFLGTSFKKTVRNSFHESVANCERIISILNTKKLKLEVLKSENKISQ